MSMIPPPPPPMAPSLKAAAAKSSSSTGNGAGASTATPPPHMNPLGSDVPVAHRFLLEVQGIQVGVFKTVSGLQVSMNTVDLNEGGNNQYTVKLPGRVTWNNITFSRGLTDSDYMFKWFKTSSIDLYNSNKGPLERLHVAVTAMSQDGKRLRAWEIIDAIPVRWKGPDFDVDSTNPLVEELEIAHHGFASTTNPSGTWAR